MMILMPSPVFQKINLVPRHQQAIIVIRMETNQCRLDLSNHRKFNLQAGSHMFTRVQLTVMLMILTAQDK